MVTCFNLKKTIPQNILTVDGSKRLLTGHPAGLPNLLMYPDTLLRRQLLAQGSVRGHRHGRQDIIVQAEWVLGAASRHHLLFPVAKALTSLVNVHLLVLQDAAGKEGRRREGAVDRLVLVEVDQGHESVQEELDFCFVQRLADEE